MKRIPADEIEPHWRAMILARSLRWVCPLDSSRTFFPADWFGRYWIRWYLMARRPQDGLESSTGSGEVPISCPDERIPNSCLRGFSAETSLAKCGDESVAGDVPLAAVSSSSSTY